MKRRCKKLQTGRSRRLKYMVLFLGFLAWLIAGSGFIFGFYSLYAGGTLNVLGHSVPGVIFAVMIALIGVRNIQAVHRLKRHLFI